MAILRHLTNPKIMGPANVQTQGEAWKMFEALAADPRVVYFDEPPGLTPVFKSFTQLARPAYQRWTDAYLAAFARCLGAEVVTFDAGLTGYPGLQVRLLTP
jgi:predicted nucleic acid-binding protein